MNILGGFMKRKLTLILATILLILMVLMTNVRQNIKVDDYVDLTEYVNRLILNEELSDDEFEIITRQTGLGKKSILALKRRSQLYLIDDYQNDYLYNRNYYKSYFALCCCEELLEESHLPFVDLQDGDILITASSVTSFFRHGHAGIVVNGLTGETVEAYSPLEKSCTSTVDTWLNYQTIMLLRVKDEYKNLAPIAAKYALENLVDVKYSLFSSVNDSTDNVKRTHCSQLVYLAYKFAGIRIDKKNNFIVTAKEISKSEYFEIVEVKGFNFYEGWK